MVRCRIRICTKRIRARGLKKMASARSLVNKMLVTGLGAAGVIGSLYFSGNEWAYKRVFMPFLHRFDAEKAHEYAIKAAKFGLVPPTFSRDPPELVCWTACMCTLEQA